MSRLNDEWKVEPHGAIEQLDDGLWTVAGEIAMPLGHFPRRMTIVRLADGRLVIWSAIPLQESAMLQLEDEGPIGYIVAPGVSHRLDLRPWKQRYPSALIVCAPGAREAVSEAVAVDATEDPFGDAAVSFQAVPGVDGKEAALLVRRSSGTSLVINDLIANVRHPEGLGAKVMARLMGFGVKEPEMPWVGEKLYVKDKEALALALLQWSTEPALRRIVVSHGDVIDSEPNRVLERIADELK
ncbi:hypothetical protein SNE35_17570 [Paucibacter sp. R3-3]|uniref:DUF4336 domain-containing protein n=1 Tax=Roseateles agri TaxID=3098619 RepID=A0ABU5DKX2_9BURK|nr:hypothetical protein [Paucibacter sp. R3-3]MDY0746325.1 hypothetical protein [Paucibacter sp. R3-3]